MTTPSPPPAAGPGGSLPATTTSRNLSGVILLRLAQLPILALFVMIVPDMMGAEIYGRFALLISIITMLSAMVNLGVGDTLGRFVPELDSTADGASRLFSSFVLLKTLVTVLVIAASIPALTLLYGDRFSVGWFVLIGAIVLLIDWETAFFSLLFGLNRLISFSLREPVRRALSLVLVIVLYRAFGLFGAIAASGVVEIGLVVLSLAWTARYLSSRYWTLSFAWLAPYLRFGLVFYGSWIIANFWQRLGNILVDRLAADSREVAYFDLGNQLYLVMLSIVLIVVNSLVPVFTKLMLAGEERKLLKWSRLVCKYLMICVMTAFAVMILIGRDVIPLVIGREYDSVYPNTALLMAGLFPMVVAQFGFVFASVYKRPKSYFGSLALSLIAFVAVSVLLVPRYASLGCSAATALSCLVFLAGQVYNFPRKMADCLREGIIAAAPGVILLPIAWFRDGAASNAILAAVFVVAYGVLLVATRRLRLQEIRELYASIRG